MRGREREIIIVNPNMRIRIKQLDRTCDYELEDTRRHSNELYELRRETYFSQTIFFPNLFPKFFLASLETIAFFIVTVTSTTPITSTTVTTTNNNVVVTL